MKQPFHLSFIPLLFLSLVACPCFAQSEQTGGSPLKVELSISHYQAVKNPVAKSDQPPLPLEIVEIPEQNGRIRVLTGEPLILNYRITNTSSEPISISLGNDLKHWIVASIKDANGRALKPIPYHRPTTMQDGPGAFDMYGMRIIALSPGSKHEGRIVLTEQFALLSAGRYQLSAKMTLPCYQGIQNYSSVDRMQPYETITQKQRLSIVAQRAGMRPLENLAQTLQRQICIPLSGNQDFDIKSLFSMPETSALPAWETLCDQHIFVGYKIFVMDELARLSTPTTVLLFGRIAANTNLPAETRHHAMGQLRAIEMSSRQNGDSQVHKVAVSLLSRLEGKVPLDPALTDTSSDISTGSSE